MSKKTTETAKGSRPYDGIRKQRAVEIMETTSYTVGDAIMSAWKRYVRDARPDLATNKRLERDARSRFVDDVLTDLTQLL